MEENKREYNREYSIVGTVTIGTDEYRDLITEKFEAVHAKNEYSRKNNEYYWKVRELEEENKKIKQELEQLKKYIKDNGEQDKLELWIVRTSRED